MSLDALIFDIDGTLSDTDPTHYLAWQDEAAKHGLDLSRETYMTQMSGRLNSDIIRDFFPQLSDEEVKAFDVNKEARYRELATTLEPLPGLRELITFAKEQGWGLAAVTNGTHLNAWHNVRALDLEEMLEHVITPELVRNAKPHPEPYLLAAERLGVEPQKTLVFEDSPSGVKSALAAGAQVIGMTTGQAAEDLLKLGVSLAIADFTDERLWSRLQQLT